MVIIGAGNVGLSVAKLLEADPARPRVKMIERGRVRAERAAEEPVSYTHPTLPTKRIVYGSEVSVTVQHKSRRLS